MPKYSKRSTDRLETCDIRHQIIFNELIKFYDCSVVCGHRGEIDQNAAYAANNSQLKFPHSKHNKTPSLAIDVIPYPYGWDSIKQFYFMAGYVQAIADKHDIEIRWGGDWDRDGDLDDNTFMDLAHFEVV